MTNNKSTPFRTVLTITVGFCVVYLATEMRWALITAICVGLIGIFSTYLSEKIDFLWMKLSWLLSLIVPNIILSLVFYLFLFPIALLSKLFGKKDPMMLKNRTDSVFVDVDRDFDKKYFERTF